MDAHSLARVDRSKGRRRLVAAALGLGLLLGPLAAASSARTDAVRTTDRSDRVTDVRPDRDRPNHDLEVLHLECGVADQRVSDEKPDPTRIRIGCRWRAATSERAAGYQLWRIVDRGERELVARGGLDMVGARDVVSAEATLVRYAVIAVDENGQRVGQSRVERVELGDDPTVDRRRAHRLRNIR